jgi:hypothetical protein
LEIDKENIKEDNLWCYYSGMPSPASYMICGECKETLDECLCEENLEK